MKDPSVWVPLVVAGVALFGVVFASIWSSHSMIKAENLRAANTIDAENVRAANVLDAENRRAAAAREAEGRQAVATLAAEDRRAKAEREAEDRRRYEARTAEDARVRAAIDAENMRHENALSQATHAHMLDATREAYVDLERARRALRRVASSSSVAHYSVEQWKLRGKAYQDDLEAAHDEFDRALDEVMLLGAVEVARAGQAVADTSLRMLVMVDVLVGRFDQIPGHPPTGEALRECQEAVKATCGALLLALRAAIHPGERESAERDSLT
ncbi:MAG: hypothetical protein FWF90_05075 [Promicromonosporaceae bacterium]|nr:hypothetical protein [Promicromonosporaceae bacterium]